MIRVEALVASPRKNGNSNLLVGRLLSALDEDRVRGGSTFLYDEAVSPCTDCRACKRGDLVCTVEDRMQPIYRKMEAAGILVFATPIYWFGPTATMKLLLERLRPYYMSQRLKDKKAVLILPAGSGPSDCDLTITMFRRVFKALGLEILGIVTPKAFNPGDALNDESALQELDRIAALINNME
ncbi:MAG: flavodoxin family protein [Bacteroidota bacterium]